jgi:hypothetical protein
MRFFLWILILAPMIAPVRADTSKSAPSETLVVTYKRSEFGDTTRKTFEQSVIELALEKTNGKTGAFEMVPVSVISRSHALAALNQNKYQNFVMTLSYEDTLLQNDNLAYIPFPIHLGAFSYRICYTNKNLIPKVQRIKNLDQLRQYKIGVGESWIDAKILQHNGLQIVEGTNITSLFRMTQAGRVDIFCPSPTEYFHELKVEKNTDLQLDNRLAFYYPLPKFLFSHKNNQALLDRIKAGIEIAYKDGSYMQLWRAAYEQDFARAKLKERNFIHMQNPFISNLDHDYKQYLFNPLAN